MKKLIFLFTIIIPFIGIAQTNSSLKSSLVGIWSFTDELYEGRSDEKITYTFNANGSGTRHTSEWKQADVLGGEIVPAETVNIKWKIQENTLIITFPKGQLEYKNLKKVNSNKITGDYYDLAEDYSPIVTFTRKK
ncbi:MAG: hypothetical protein ACI31D_09520 [Candidatus Limisoma sp.]